MSVNLAACATAFLVAFIILPVLIKYSHEKNLVDAPDQRKIHTKLTPSLGGIAIFVGFLTASMIWMDFSQWPTVRYVLASLFIVFLLGVRDDLVPFRPLHKLIGQIIAVIILLFSGIEINSFYGLFGIEEIPAWIGIPITAFTVVVITNSFNLIDGLDGLAGSIGIVALGAFGFWFYGVHYYTSALFCFAMIGGILAFLVFNWEPSEIFMGDTGAMLIGMLLALLLIHFMQVNHSLPQDNPFRFTGVVSSAAAFIIIPLCDTVRIMIVRISRGQSPFKPDKSHIHHQIMRLGITHARTSLILASINGLFIVAAFSLRHAGDKVMLPLMIFALLILNFVLARLINSRKKRKDAAAAAQATSSH